MIEIRTTGGEVLATIDADTMRAPTTAVARCGKLI